MLSLVRFLYVLVHIKFLVINDRSGVKQNAHTYKPVVSSFNFFCQQLSFVQFMLACANRTGLWAGKLETL